MNHCKQFIFTHHPRTGGTYLTNLLYKNGVSIKGNHNTNAIESNGFIPITLLRHPLDRVVSYLKFVRRGKRVDKDCCPSKHGTPNGRFWTERGWREFVDIKKSDSFELCNAMTKRLAGHETIQGDSLDAAKRALESYAAVGVNEDYDKFIERISEIAKVKIVQDNKISRNSSKTVNCKLTQDDMDWLDSMNQLDFDLWRYAISEADRINSKAVVCIDSSPAKIVRGAIGLAKAIVGADPADDQTIQKRRALCRACEHAERCTHDVSLFCQCKKCGCFLKAKTRLKSESCPIGKW